VAELVNGGQGGGSCVHWQPKTKNNTIDKTDTDKTPLGAMKNRGFVKPAVKKEKKGKQPLFVKNRS